MESGRNSLDELFLDFPELLRSDVVLQKEVYAHFGLLYMGFALLEHSLINTATIHFAGSVLRNRPNRKREDWPSIHDKAFDDASRLTLGNLIKCVAQVQEFHDMSDRFTEVKKIRDYFSHHFFRREAAHMGEWEPAMALLADMRQAKLSVDAADKAASSRHISYLTRLGWPEIHESFISGETNKMVATERAKLEAGTLPRGNKRWLDRGPEE